MYVQAFQSIKDATLSTTLQSATGLQQLCTGIRTGKLNKLKNSPKIQQSLSSKPSMAKAAAEASFVVVCNQVKHKKPFTDGGYGKKMAITVVAETLFKDHAHTKE